MDARVAVTPRLLVVLMTVVWWCLHTSAAARQCLDADQAESCLSCEFHENFCKWNNTNSWSRHDKQWLARHDYAEAVLDGAGSRVVLESPPLCATGNGSFLRLGFEYYMGDDRGRCQLTVSVRTPADSAVLATWTNHSPLWFDPVDPQHIICPDSWFKIVFEAKKCVNDSCTAGGHGLQIANISVRFITDNFTGPFTTCPSADSAARLPTSPSPADTVCGKKIKDTDRAGIGVMREDSDGGGVTTEDSDDGSWGGLAVAIAVAAGVGVFICVLFLPYVLRSMRRTDLKKQAKSPARKEEPTELINPAFNLDNLSEPADPDIENGAVQSTNVSGGTTDAALLPLITTAHPQTHPPTHSPRPDKNGYELVQTSENHKPKHGGPEAQERETAERQ